MPQLEAVFDIDLRMPILAEGVGEGGLDGSWALPVDTRLHQVET